MKTTTDAAKAMLAAGFHIRPFTTNKKSALEAGWLEAHTPAETDERTSWLLTRGEASGVGVVVGPGGIIERAGHQYLPFALEHEGHSLQVQDWEIQWSAALGEYGMTETFEKLSNGWSDMSPSGGKHWYGLVELPAGATKSDAESFISALPCRAVIRTEDTKPKERVNDDAEAKERITMAELLIDTRAVIVAPSGGSTHPTGQPWKALVGSPASVPILDWAEVMGLSDVLARLTEVSETKTGMMKSVDSRSARVLHSLDRAGTPQKTQDLLEANGWTVTGRSGDGTITMKRDGHAEVRLGGVRRNGSLRAWGASGPFALDRETRYAEIVAILGHGGDLTATAIEAEEKKLVALPVTALAPATTVSIKPETTSNVEMTSQVSRALAESRFPDGLPFLISERGGAENSHVGFVTMTPTHEIRRWAPEDGERLCLMVAQPSTSGGVTRPPKCLHTLPNSVVAGALESARESCHQARYVSNIPLLLPDGTIISKDGYYPAKSALVAIPDRSSWENYHVPENPDALMAQRAADYLVSELLGDFPFETVADQARALAYLLTCVSRDLATVVPGFLFTAPERGSGKDLMASLGRIIATGSSAYSTIDSDASQTVRRVVTAQLTGSRFLHRAEIERGASWKDETIQELITSGETSQRVLGGNTSIIVSGRIVTACGNNAAISSDLVRRFVPVRLHYRGAGLAAGRVGFRHKNLTAWTMENRGKLLAALHTILSCGIRNVGDYEVPGLTGGFPQWSQLVVGSMSLLTIGGQNAGYLVTSDRTEWIEESDAEGAEWAEVMSTWKKAFPEQWVGADMLRQHLVKKLPPSARPPLPEALLGVAEYNDRSMAMQWGRVLDSRRDTRVLIDGVPHWIERKKHAGHSSKFRVVWDSEAEGNPTPLSEPDEPEMLEIEPDEGSIF